MLFTEKSEENTFMKKTIVIGMLAAVALAGCTTVPEKVEITTNTFKAIQVFQDGALALSCDNNVEPCNGQAVFVMHEEGADPFMEGNLITVKNPKVTNTINYKVRNTTKPVYVIENQK